jgi:hypothetical protein
MEFKTKEQLQEYLVTQFPIDTKYDAIVNWLWENGFEYSALTDNVVYGSIIIEKKILITTKLLVQFVFTPDKLLKQIIVEEGITGL